MQNRKNRYLKLYDRLEFFLALFLIAIAVFIAGICIYECDFYKNQDLYLNTTDGLPIYSKVNYAVECLKSGNWPSWFPNWYCGTSFSQYYPPLTYILLVPIDFLLGNDNASLQIYMFLGMLCGGMGIWYLYRRYLGRFWGVMAGVLYVMLPYFIISFYSWGVIAQIPIVAIAPWYLACCLRFYESEKWYWWLGAVALSFVLLMSHVMHGFLIALCVFVPFFILAVRQKEKSFSALLMWGVGTALSAGALGFWWVTGVLPLENPGVPYLSPDAALDVTANLTWFFPKNVDLIGRFFPQMKNTINAYFPFIIIFVAFVSYVFIRKQEKGRTKTVLMFLYIQTVFSFFLSFGSYLPFFRFIPLARQLVPGRVLTQTAIGAVILTVFVLAKLMRLVFRRVKDIKARELLVRAGGLILVVAIFGFVVSDYRYEKTKPKYLDEFKIEKRLYSMIEDDLSNFQKGRVAWYGSNFGSIYCYFAEKYDFNIVSGWNIEGTTLGDYLRYQNVAVHFEKKEFLLKKLYDMNVQYCFLNKDELSWFESYLEENNFMRIGAVQNIEVLKRDSYSYFFEQKRNALVIGKADNIFISEFPWFVKGYSASPSDYNQDYFDDFDYVYYCEPEINNLVQVSEFEDQVRDLAKRGKKVYIEFGRTSFPYKLFDVYPNDREVEDGFIINSSNDFDGRSIYTRSDGGRFVEVFGLDKVLYKMVNSTGVQTVNLIGTKRVGNSDVYFIGGPASQLKSFAFGYLTGKREFDSGFYIRDEIISDIFNGIFDEGIYRGLSLPAFNAENVEWKVQGCDFEYESSVEKRVMASITYSPRWKVYVDEIEIKVYNMDNMLVFNLPEGRHSVRLVYGTTGYSLVGLCVTAFSLMLIFLILIFYKRAIKIFDNIAKRFLIYLEILESE